MLEHFDSINSILDSIKSTIEIIPHFKSSSPGSLVNKNSIKLENDILNAQNALSKIQLSYNNLVQEKNSLERELIRQKQWDEEKKEYILKRIGKGGFVYSHPDSFITIDLGRYWLCTNCFDKGEKSILQISHKGRQGNPNTWKCFSCELAMQVEYDCYP